MNQERIDRLFSCRNEQGFDSISYDKRKILEDLYKDSDIIEILNNKELQAVNACPEDYYNVNIYSFLKIPDAQSKIMVSKQIIFRTIAHQDDVSTIWGIDRQDLLAALVKERFQWSNILGTQLIKTYDSGKVAENGYYYRNMYFEQTAPNDIQNRLKSNRLDKLGRDYYG